MELLRCTDVTKVYGTENPVTALDHVNLRVGKGEFVSIVGASGSGKSTLLYCLGTLETPDSGEIVVEGQPLAGLDAKSAAIFRRRYLGIIYQFYNLIPELTVKENIELPVKLDGRNPDPAFLAQLVETMGLAPLLDKYPNQLSGGQQQRTAIARALLPKPALILADEPTGNLDRKNSQEILDLLKLCARQFKQTILLVTHDEQAALQADRTITLSDGKIV